MSKQNPLCARRIEKSPEGVMVLVVSGLKLHVHQVHGAERRAQKEDLHRRVVERYVAGEQVQVPGREHDREQQLRPS